MESVYSALILHSLGKDISEAAIEKIVKAAGGKADKTQIKTLVTALGEMDIAEVLEKAPITGTAPSVSGAGGGGDSSAPAKEEKKEKEEEEEEEEEAAGLDALFG